MWRWAMLRSAIAAAALMTLCAGVLHAEERPVSMEQLPAIRKDLASADFAVRDAAQKMLDRISAKQVEALRAAAKGEADPEVKARLDERIEGMELYNLLHPPGLSLKVQVADLNSVAAALNTQLGDAAAIQGRVGGPYTLDVRDKPFGELLELLNAQQPFTVGTTTTIGPGGLTVQVVMQPQGGGVAQQKLTGMESFACLSQVVGNPAAGTWGLRMTVIADPRIRITQYVSVVEVDKMTDQNGRSLMPLVMNTGGGTGTLSRPALGIWGAGADFRPRLE